MNTGKAKQYNRIKLIVSLTNLVIDLIFWILIIVTGFASAIAGYAYGVVSYPLLQFYVFALILGIIHLVINFPLSIYSGYILEHRFSLSNQTLAGWFREQAKGLMVGLILGSIVMVIFYLMLWKLPQLWWLGVWIFILIFSVLLTRVAPVLIFPLFYKFKNLENDELKDRIKSFGEKWNLHIKGVFQFNLSKTTRKANAAFTGLGKTKRVILGDTLLDNFTPEEIETVFAHEVGHYVKKHLLKGIIFSSAVSFAGLYLTFRIYQTILNHLQLPPQALNALPYLGLIFFIYGLISGPLGNWISRIYEYQADHFAVTSTGQPGVYEASLRKLADLNLADESPHPMVEFLFYSHPSIQHRINKISGANT
jgi:STE24 endopeptidase